MNPERWQQVKDLLDQAISFDPAERSSYLNRECGTDVQLRLEVESLLSSHQRAGTGFMRSPADVWASAAVGIAPARDPRVGPYQLLKEIGHGGMGEVYRAIRADGQYKKEVAIKFVRGAFASSFLLERFRIERQILASLDHPNIARLLDGGTTDDGVPYLVMDLIEGLPIDQYCNDHGLSVSERLQLFRQVCEAVQYAHQRLVIHRDIKPGNILVTAEGTPKLLDFGIAKLLDPSAHAETTMARPMTPEYASPEQIRGEPITTATDVYSLGVVLYELLTGQSPYPKEHGTSQETARAICELEPAKPSTAVRLRELRSDRISAPEKLAKQLRGDVDNIVLMALRKEPERRYASVQQFAEDIRRSLEDLPVIARKDSARYRAEKFMVRHKAGVAAAMAVALTLIAGMIVTTREARIAERHFNDVRGLTNSLIFDVHDSIKELPGSTPARKLIIDRALKYLNLLAQESTGDLSLQRELAIAYEKVGEVQGDYLENNLGDSEGTLASYQKALAIRKQIDANSKDWNDRLALAQEYRLVAHQLWANGDPGGARDPIERAIAISEALNSLQPNNAKVLYELSFDHEVSGRIGYRGDPLAREKRLRDYRRALTVDEMALKLTPDDLLTLHGYAVNLESVANLVEASDPKEALQSYQKALEINRRLVQLSPNVRYRRSVAIAYGEIASAYDDLGEYSASLENNLKDLEIYQDLIHADPKNVLLQQGIAITYVNTAMSAERVGRLSMALDYSSRGLDIMKSRILSAPEKAFQRGVYAAMLVDRGTILTVANKPDAAISDVEQGRSIYEGLFKAGGINHANVAACDVKLGEAAANARYTARAAGYFHEALEIAEPLTSTQPPDLDALYAAADAYSGLGELSLKEAKRGHRKSDWIEAQSWFQKSLNTWRRIEHPNRTAPNSFQVGDPAALPEKLRVVDKALAAAH
jgi:serine/threonine protein kinase